MVCELALCNRGLAAQRQCLGRADRVEPGVDLAVDAADEEAGDAGDLGQIGPRCRGVLLESVDVRVHHTLVTVEAEDQRDVDVASLGDHLADRADALRGAGDLHHQVRPSDLFVQRTSGRGRAGLVVRKRRLDLDADESVAAIAVAVEVGELVERTVDVGKHECPVLLADAAHRHARVRAAARRSRPNPGWPSGRWSGYW